MSKGFIVTKDHLKLLDHMYISWGDCEFGAPAVDPKRPYGNSSVIADIAEILGWMDDDWWNGDQNITDEWDDHGNKIHKEMQTVLQILVSNRSIEEGRYETSSNYGIDYRKVDS